MTVRANSALLGLFLIGHVLSTHNNGKLLRTNKNYHATPAEFHEMIDFILRSINNHGNLQDLLKKSSSFTTSVMYCPFMMYLYEQLRSNPKFPSRNPIMAIIRNFFDDFDQEKCPFMRSLQPNIFAGTYKTLLKSKVTGMHGLVNKIFEDVEDEFFNLRSKNHAGEAIYKRSVPEELLEELSSPVTQKPVSELDVVVDAKNLVAFVHHDDDELHHEIPTQEEDELEEEDEEGYSYSDFDNKRRPLVLEARNNNKILVAIYLFGHFILLFLLIVAWSYWQSCLREDDNDQEEAADGDRIRRANREPHAPEEGEALLNVLVAGAGADADDGPGDGAGDGAGADYGPDDGAGAYDGADDGEDAAGACAGADDGAGAGVGVGADDGAGAGAGADDGAGAGADVGAVDNAFLGAVGVARIRGGQASGIRVRGGQASGIRVRGVHDHGSHGRGAHGRGAHGRGAHGRITRSRDAIGRDAIGLSALGRDVLGSAAIGGEALEDRVEIAEEQL
ncbi:uncharacterized protein LOC108679871 isoform X1 [Hyalella azteca]|uniref:Uncharacterized protein LOC108679871 isoform X1 n=1 Tax=Hyalella azteca TaxID=294128 RepID=A0A979FQG4_HYAAZ|nr:uncharacterized protein LOC108679871 isoform X1 [Hyalella azteca]